MMDFLRTFAALALHYFCNGFMQKGKFVVAERQAAQALATERSVTSFIWYEPEVN